MPMAKKAAGESASAGPSIMVISASRAICPQIRVHLRDFRTRSEKPSDHQAAADETERGEEQDLSGHSPGKGKDVHKVRTAPESLEHHVVAVPEKGEQGEQPE